MTHRQKRACSRHFVKPGDEKYYPAHGAPDKLDALGFDPETVRSERAAPRRWDETAGLLVCGGAGCIGSHMVRLLLREKHDMIVYDNLSTGHAQAVPTGLLVQGDIGDA